VIGRVRVQLTAVVAGTRHPRARALQNISMAVEKDTQGSLEHPPDHALIAATVRWEELPPELLRHLMRQLCPPQLLHLR
jgi:hypothetical protein